MCVETSVKACVETSVETRNVFELFVEGLSWHRHMLPPWHKKRASAEPSCERPATQSRAQVTRKSVVVAKTARKAVGPASTKADWVTPRAATLAAHRPVTASHDLAGESFRLIDSVFTEMHERGIMLTPVTGTVRQLARKCPRTDCHGIFVTACLLAHHHVVQHYPGMALTGGLRVRLAACLSLAIRFELDEGAVLDNVTVGGDAAIGVLAWRFLDDADRATYNSAHGVTLLLRFLEQHEISIITRKPGLLELSTTSSFSHAEGVIWCRVLTENARALARAALVHYTHACILHGRVDVLTPTRTNVQALVALALCACKKRVTASAETHALCVALARIGDASSGVELNAACGTDLSFGAVPTLQRVWTERA